MKTIMLPLNNFILLLSFTILLLTGEAFGGPYILFYFYGIFNGILYSRLAISGVVFFVVANFIVNSKSFYKPLLSFFGTLFLCFSLVNFFSRDRLHDNSSIKEQIVPLIVLFIFVIASLINLYGFMIRLSKIKSNKVDLPNSVSKVK